MNNKPQTGMLLGEEAPIFYAYTRAMAIADGVLVDLSDNPIMQQVFKVPVAMSASLFYRVVMGEDEIEKDITEPMISVAQAIRSALSAPDALNRSLVSLSLPSLDDSGFENAVLHIGPGDEGEPVATICYRIEL